MGSKWEVNADGEVSASGLLKTGDINLDDAYQPVDKYIHATTAQLLPYIRFYISATWHKLYLASGQYNALVVGDGGGGTRVALGFTTDDFTKGAVYIYPPGTFLTGKRLFHIAGGYGPNMRDGSIIATIDYPSAYSAIPLELRKYTPPSTYETVLQILTGGTIEQKGGAGTYHMPPKMSTSERNTMTSGWGSEHEGAMWFNSDTKKMEYWDGSAVQSFP